MQHNSSQRALSRQAVRDAPSLSSRRSSTIDQEEGYRYVDCANTKYRKSPMHFSISIDRIDGSSTKKTCHPGSIFEGIIHIKLESPLAAQYLKLIFKAAERIHDSSTKRRGERLFAVRTILWGSSSTLTQRWPIMEKGHYQFPFMCEIPMVNYPPTFKHHLVSCEFELMACLERPGIGPFQTTPYSLRYEPYILSCSPKSSQLYQEKYRISNNVNVLVTLLNGCHFNLLDISSDMINIQLSIIPLDNNNSNSDLLLSHIEACIKREVTVTHGSSYHQSDTMVMSHVEQSTFGVCKSPIHSIQTFYIQLPIPSEINKTNRSNILKNFSVLGMTPTIDFSRHVKMDYKLYITAKVKHRFIATKRQLFCIPIQFGTLAPGEQLPSSLVSYRDPQVISDTTLNSKPKFIRPPFMEEQLPTYDQDLSPPQYRSSLITL